MANTSVITVARRKKLCQATSGATPTIAAITEIAFGDGGSDENGEPLAPSSTQTALKHEIGRYAVENITYPQETTATYTVSIPKGELVGKQISEAALVDADGDLCAVKNMYPKGKDEDVEFTFTFDDEF